MPPFAPILNPVEGVWSYLKHGLMANFVPRDVHHLDHVVQSHLAGLGGNPRMIRSLWAGSKLSSIDKNLAT